MHDPEGSRSLNAPPYESLSSDRVRQPMSAHGRCRPQGRCHVDFDAINRAVLAVFPLVLERILPEGKRFGPEYVAINPCRADRHLGSFRINMRTGKWADFATSDRGGDPISLVAYLEETSQVDAARLLARMVRITL